eukprot:TRINITY_DN4632_c0_g1_i8.p2 TRINITY_DN4632_c0_g1~~TRINITY_DN4632_c0_g1_i8.p2  ORF type:complete len:175 (-),score=14.62 TRINITY_DN4632_c0_g1_i8:605-1129(-)
MSGESSLSWRGSLILPNELYIGGIFDTVNLVKQDNTHNIRAILTVADVPLRMVNSLRVLPPAFIHKQFVAHDVDEEDLLRFFDDCIEFICEQKSSGGTLVHCMAGISRSSTVCTAYVMKTRKYGRDKAFYDVVRKAHPCACPNNGFWEQLAEYERILSAEMELDMDVQTSKNEF